MLVLWRYSNRHKKGYEMKTQWIFYGLEQGGYGSRFHITQEMTEREFLDKYGICVSITYYCPVKSLTLERVSQREKFSKKDTDNSGLGYLKQKFTDREINRIGAECIGTSISIDLVARYVKYRIEIKKPIKTTRPLKAFIKKLIEAEIKGYSVEQVVDIMMENEWATFELEWIDKKIPKKSTRSSLSEFGFNQDAQRLFK